MRIPPSVARGTKLVENKIEVEVEDETEEEITQRFKEKNAEVRGDIIL